MQTPEMLLQWIRLRTKPVAIFYEDDKFFPMSIHTRRFILMLADFPQELMGVYTKTCTVEWLAEDMEYMCHGQKKSKFIDKNGRDRFGQPHYGH